MSGRSILPIGIGLFLILSSLAKAADSPVEPKPEGKFLSVEGRLILQPQKPQNKLLLYGKDDIIYNIRGEYKDLLKSILSDLGEKNWVSVSGENQGVDTIICHKKTTIDKNRGPKVEMECLRQYHLYITKITSAAVSEEETPKPKMTPEENSARSDTLSIEPPPSIFLIQGKITAINLRSPIKTIEITFPDKDKNLIRTNLMLNTNTKIARLEGKEPMYVSIHALKQGQKVDAEYTFDSKGQTIALAITILEE